MVRRRLLALLGASLALGAGACASLLGITDIVGVDGSADAEPSDAGDGSPMATCDADTQTDPNNCGYCGHWCCGGGCDAGACEAITLGQGNSPYTVAVGEGHIYWGDVTDAGGALMTLPDDGGIPRVLVQGSGVRPNHIAVANGWVYWTVPVGNALPGTVWKVPADGGTPTEIYSGSAADSPWGIAVGSSSVYWANKRNAGGAIESTPLDGGPTTVITDAGYAQPFGVVMDSAEKTLYFTVAGFAVTDAGPVCAPGSVHSIVLSTSADTELAAGLLCPQDIALGGSLGSFLLFPSDQVAPSGAIARLSVFGGQPQKLVLGLNYPYAIAADATNVYFSDYGLQKNDAGLRLNRVMSTPVDGSLDGGALTLASGAWGAAYGVATDARCVYWAGGNGLIGKVAKP